MESSVRWLVSETGREAHLVENGEARCGEPGNGWRAVAGMPLCPICARDVVKENTLRLATM